MSSQNDDSQGVVFGVVFGAVVLVMALIFGFKPDGSWDE